MMLRTPAAKRPRVLTILDDDGVAPAPAIGDPADNAGVISEIVPYDRERNLDVYDPLLCDDAGVDDDWESMRCSYKCRNMVKSELLETLERRETQVFDLEASIRKLKSCEIENQKLTLRVNSLEQAVAASTCQEQALRKQRLEETAIAEERFRKQLLRCNETHEKLMAEIRLKAEIEANAKVAEDKVESLTNELVNLKDSTSKAIQLLERDLQNMEENNEFCMSKLNAENDAYRREAESATEELSSLRVQYAELQEKLNTVMQEKRIVEKDLATVSSKISNTRLTDSEEAEAVIKSLRDELSHQCTEILEAKRVKANHVRQQALEEQVQTFRNRAEQAESKLADYVDMQLRVSSLEKDLDAWERVLHTIPGNLSRDDIPGKLLNLQRDLLVGLSENGELKAKVNELQIMLERSLAEKRESVALAASARQQVEEAQGKISRLERQVVSLTRERDGVKSILASYDEEESFLLQQQKAASTATPEKSKQKQIEELESLLASSQETIQSLEKDLEESIRTSKDSRKVADRLSADLEAARSEISSLERESLRLRQEVGLLERKLACGEFDPAKTKVLKLRTRLDFKESVPSRAVHVATQDAADAAHERVASILESKERIATLTNKVCSLEQEISTLKKRESRYMQVFAEKAFTFRTACGLIFGYEILMNEEPDSAVTFFKLRSVYSRDKECETLEFQYTANGHAVGRIDMLANDYTTSPEIARQVTTFLQGFKSIPAFIANLTLEQFNKGTIG